MKNTKQEIRDTARNLFNEKGFGQVTIRMIAQELQMSSGNLNYHYKKREDILEALYFEMVKDFDDRVRRVEGQDFDLAKIKAEVQASMKRMIEYQFFWTDLFHLLSVNDRIREHFDQAYAQRVQGTQALFGILQKKGLLQAPTFEQEFDFLIRRMIDFGNTWLYASSLHSGVVLDSGYIDEQSKVWLAMLYPYLTKAGKQQFQQLNAGIL